MSEAILCFKTLWVTRYGYPEILVYDKAFNSTEFKEYLDKAGISKNVIPSGRHNKNVLESKHKVLRDTYSRLSYENDTRPEI